MSSPDLPLPLRNALLSGRAVLFVGAGVGSCIADAQGKALPDGRALARDLLRDFSLSSLASDDLAAVAQVVELRHGRRELEAYLNKRFTGVTPDEHIQWLTTVPWRAIFTTNYDDAIERAYSLVAHIRQQPITISATSDLIDWDPRVNVPVYHLHGVASSPEKSRLVITRNDYPQYAARRKMLFEVLKQQFATSPIIYLGYSNRDPNWQALHAAVLEEFFPSTPPQSFRVVKGSDALENEILESQGVTTIDQTVEDFVDAAAAVTAASTFSSDHIEVLRRGVPSDFVKAFEESPAPTARLLQNWIYLNSYDFTGSSNLRDFLLGDRPNWQVVARATYFRRDLEDAVFDDLLDFATASRVTTTASIVLAPAGYGTTTLLMALAMRAVTEDVAKVLVHRPGASLHPGDIDFATDVLGAPVIFVIDEAANTAAELANALNLLRQVRRPALFLCGDRLNEWRQSRNALRGREHLIGELSDGEIERLLDFLEKHDALGNLTHLSRDFQVAAVKNKHDKQLLVLMREVTEGRGFDAIIEDEFRHIESELARRFYAYVCCFYHLRVPVRDRVVATLLGVHLEDLYRATNDAVEGVIQLECVNDARGEYAARARHQSIAEIVWERCVVAGERDGVLLRAMEALNLNYGLDVRVFDAFVRSDRDIDALSSLESKTRFFETACRKDPDSPYVRQHYARMLLRAGRPELALAQIERALTNGANIRVLHHTKGEILKRLALDAASLDVGRRYLVKSEAAYKQSQAMSPKDPYPYQGLADLYLEWAKRCETEDESAEYLERSQEVINRGLPQVRDKEGLWIISSRIQDWLGNRPAAVMALQRAAAAAPVTSVGRYLLARAYYRTHEYDKVLATLAPLIKTDPNQYEACLLYAEAQLALGAPMAEAIAILQVGNLYGMRDARFIATLGGLLTLSGNLTAAAEVFARGTALEFGVEELRENLFVPRDASGSKQRMTGMITRVAPGFVWVSVPGMSDFFAFGSKFGGVAARKGLAVDFVPAFSARGPYVLNLTVK